MHGGMNRRTRLKHWSLKFRNAIRGMRVGVRGQTSFYAHFAIATIVFILAIYLQVNLVEWSALLLCMGLVLSAEMFNSSIESLAKAITLEHDNNVRDALDIASGAVLVASLFAAIVGASILLFRLGLMLGYWGGYLSI